MSTDDSQEVVIYQAKKYTVEQMITAWIDAKFKKSRSEKTRHAYEEAITGFRAKLQQFGLDLDSQTVKIVQTPSGPQEVDEVEQLFLAAQGWAGQRSPQSTRDGEIAQSTYNQRIAILSSFYEYAKSKLRTIKFNPMDLVERARVEDYAHATALDADEVQQLLASVDRSTLPGKRDYALFCVAILTGWRASAIVGMDWGHITVKAGKKDSKVTIFSPRMKGGKTGVKELDAGTSAALLTYVHALYGSDLGHLENTAPIWVALSHNGYRGKRISVRSLEHLCKKYLNVGTFHLFRHTHALNMKKAGATIDEIQESLDHESPVTTRRYVPKLERGVNKHGRKMESMFGISAQETEEPHE